MNKKTIKINFAKFWSGFNPNNNFFIYLLKKKFNVILSETPGFVFYSSFQGEMPDGKYIKIF